MSLKVKVKGQGHKVKNVEIPVFSLVSWKMSKVKITRSRSRSQSSWSKVKVVDQGQNAGLFSMYFPRSRSQGSKSKVARVKVKGHMSGVTVSRSKFLREFCTPSTYGRCDILVISFLNNCSLSNKQFKKKLTQFYSLKIWIPANVLILRLVSNEFAKQITHYHIETWKTHSQNFSLLFHNSIGQLKFDIIQTQLRPPRGVCEPHLHQT